MQNWIITKDFEFCYGHRVWNQQLNADLSIDGECKCRHLHGHNGTVTVQLKSSILSSGMVTDFKHLNWFKKFLDDHLDHKFLIDSHDPLFNTIVPQNVNGEDVVWQTHPEGHKTVDTKYLEKISKERVSEILSGIVIVDFLPTSELLSMWLSKILTDKMRRHGIFVHSVSLHESNKTHATYQSS